MKQHMAFVAAFLLVGSVGLFSPSPAVAGPSGAGTSKTKEHAKHAWFNPSSIETIQGKVTSVMTPQGKKGMAADMRLDLKTDHGTMPVILGPASYVKKEEVKVNKGDEISVTGSRIMMHKKTELVATEIKKGNEKLDLRKSDGTPLWSVKMH
jgi:hypothetical protein